MDTREMNAVEIKERIGFHDRNLRFTLWAENGTQGFHFADHASFEGEIASKWAEQMWKSKTRMAVLDTKENNLYLFSCEVSRRAGSGPQVDIVGPPFSITHKP